MLDQYSHIPSAAEVWIKENEDGTKETETLHPCTSAERTKLAEKGFIPKKVFHYRLGGYNEAIAKARDYAKRLEKTTRK